MLASTVICTVSRFSSFILKFYFPLLSVLKAKLKYELKFTFKKFISSTVFFCGSAHRTLKVRLGEIL